MMLFTYILILLLYCIQYTVAYSKAIQIDNILQQHDLFTQHNHIKLAAHTHHMTVHEIPVNTVNLFDRYNVQSTWQQQHDYMSHEHYKSSKQLYLLHVKTPITQQKINTLTHQLQAYNALLISYIPHNTYLVGIDNVFDIEDTANVLKRLHTVIDVLHYQPQHKLHHKLHTVLTTTDITQHIHTLRGKHYNAETQHHTLRLHINEFMLDTSLNELALHWQNTLRNNNVDVSLYQSTSKYVDVVVHNDCLTDTVLYLLHRAHVHYIEPKTKFVIQNKYATVITQSDRPNVRSIFAHNIRGDNQIVTVSDTGVDYNNCFFNDPNVPVPINKTDFTHRKIVSYIAIGDAQDEADGHGSHVSGTLAGSMLDTSNPLSAYSGAAPNAKLAVFDFSLSGNDDLTVPDDIIADYFKRAGDEMHSYITSDSWGSESGDYDSYCLDTDTYVWNNPDLLPVFAAGNYGDNQGYGSISSPGVAKNVLTVGSSKSSPESFTSLGIDVGIQITQPRSIIGEYSVTPASFGLPFYRTSFGVNNSIVVANPFNACDNIINTDEVQDAIVLVQRGVCHFDEKIFKLQQFGAKLVIVVQNELATPVIMGGDKEKQITIPSVMISKVIGEAMRDIASQIRITLPYTVLPDNENEHWLSDFSSRGPAIGNRQKPDIVAPGEMIVSVRASGNTTIGATCPATLDDMLPLQGTSMAAPVVAGSAALVRQYFMDGYYPTGQPNANNKLTPSAALLKAMIIQSGVSVGGTVTTASSVNGVEQHVVQSSPSMFQGYGRILLDNVLKFDTESLQQLKIYDRKQVQTGDIHTYCYRVNNGSVPFRATLTYNDAPITISSVYLLVNDLDMILSDTTSNTAFIGNHQARSQVLWDSINNVEQVHVNQLNDNTVYSLHIRGTHVPVGPQPYALVVQGDIAEVDITQCSGTVICPNACSSHGVCQASGICQCDATYSGADCSLQASALLRDDSHGFPIWMTKGTVESLDWSYHYIDVKPSDFNESTTGLALLVQRLGSVGDPDLYINMPTATNDNTHSYPTYSSYTHVLANCDSCVNPQIDPLVIPVKDIVFGRIKVGITAYCCDDTDYIVTALVYDGPIPGADTLPQNQSWYEMIKSNRLLASLLLVILILASALLYTIINPKVVYIYAPGAVPMPMPTNIEMTRMNGNTYARVNNNQQEDTV